jgi:hypothetical protein
MMNGRVSQVNEGVEWGSWSGFLDSKNFTVHNPGRRYRIDDGLVSHDRWDSRPLLKRPQLHAIGQNPDRVT